MFHSSVYFKDNQEIIYRSDISNEEVQRVEDNLKTLRDAMTEIDYCTMVRDNIFDFLKDTETNNIRGEKMFVRLNRFMMNWLNAFYTWIQYHERHQKVLFSELKVKYYNASFEYRFAYAMRKYSTHQALCITSTSLDLLTNDTVFQINLHDILQNKNDLKSDIKTELESMSQSNSYIDALLFTKRFLIVFEQMQGEIWERNKDSVVKSTQELLKISQGVEYPIFDSYIKHSNNSTISVGIQIRNFIRKLQHIMVPDYLEKYIKAK